MLARKVITVKGVGDDPPISLWKSLISEVVTVGKKGHCIDRRTHLFLQKLKKPLEYLRVKYSLDVSG